MHQTIKIRHNVEMAHRLSQTPGKCSNIHGHSWNVILSLTGPIDEKGIVIEFGDAKRKFRSYLDTEFDHRLLLNSIDEHRAMQDVGVKLMNGDPTTENFARLIWEWATGVFPNLVVFVEVWETATNCATYPEEMVYVRY